MPRKKAQLDAVRIEELKGYVHQSFGKAITHSVECEQLSNDIQRVTGQYLSPNTLRRFLGFLHAQFSPSPKTLNTLAAYTGFSNWHSYLQKEYKQEYSPLTIDQEIDLILGFYQIEMKEEGDMNFHNACRNIALRIVSNPALLEKLSPQLAKNPVSQIYFFERFPFIDGLCRDYKRSVQLYLQKKTGESKVFGQSLLLLSEFLCGNYRLVRSQFEKLKIHAPNHTMHPFVIARYIGSHILDRKVRNEGIEECVEESNRWNNYFLHKESKTFWQYPYFQHMMAGYFNLAGYFDEAYHLVRTIKFNPRKMEIENGYPQALEIVTQLAHHQHSPEAFKKWVKTTSAMEECVPFFKKFYKLQVLTAYRNLLKEGKRKHEVETQITDLVHQTGFRHFLLLMENANDPE
jgi:hypothetical protein